MDAEMAKRYAMSLKRLRADLDILAAAIETGDWLLASIAITDIEVGGDAFMSSMAAEIAALPEVMSMYHHNDEVQMSLFVETKRMEAYPLYEAELHRRGVGEQQIVDAFGTGE